MLDDYLAEALENARILEHNLRREVYLTGLFSQLDELLSEPMGTILRRLPLSDRIADAMFQEALLRPEQYQILATPNLNGDYISDALAAQVGGLGLAPGVNMSDTLAFYEATHGTAPTIAGKDKANPGSVILCGALMLENIGVPKAAERIRSAVSKAIAAKAVTEDLAAQVLRLAKRGQQFRLSFLP